MKLNKKEALAGISAVVLSILAIAIFAHVWFASEEEKIITVKEKWVKYHGSDAKYLFSDTEGNVYCITDEILLGKWDASNRYAKLEEGKTYKVKLYGWRIPIFSFYQNAVEIEEINND